MCFAFQMCFKENGEITKILKNILGIFIFHLPAAPEKQVAAVEEKIKSGPEVFF